MQVELIAYSKPIKGRCNPMAIVEQCASVCYDSEPDFDKFRIANGCAKTGHMSVYEHAYFTFHVSGISRACLAQLSRHRHFSFCVSGDTVVGYNRRHKGMTVRQLAEMTDQYKKMTKLRSINETTKEIFYNDVIDAWSSGKKPVYRIKTEHGYEIKATKEHEFFTGVEYKQLKDLSVGDFVYTNGVIAYQSKDWLNQKYNIENLEQEEIAKLCGVSSHTIRKWVRKFGLQKTMGSWSIGKEPPNKGKTKENYEPLRRSSEKLMGNTLYKYRTYKRNEHPETITGGYFLTRKKYPKKGICQICGFVGNTETHHVDKNPCNTEPENIMELCTTCHKRMHDKDAVMAAKPEKIISIEYVGEEETYDVEMKAPYNNFVANGFIVHNCVRSQRYCDESDNGVLGCIIPKAFNDEQLEIAMQTYSEEIDKYKVLLASGAAKEDARMVLPNAMETELYLSANARALIEASHLRLCNRAQEEIRTMFGKMKEEVEQVSPEIAKMMVPQCEVNPSYPCCAERESCGRHKTLKEVYKSDV